MRPFRWLAAALLLGMAAFVMLGSAPSAAAPTCTKTLVTNGLWTTASSWSPAAVPTATDYACVPAGLTATLNASRTVDGVSIQGQLAGTGTLSVSDAGVASPSELSGTISIAAFRILVGSLAVDSAFMEGAGTTTVASGASMTVRNADYYGLVLSGTRSLVNNGTVTLAEEVGTPYESLLLNEAGTSVTNNGTLDLQAGADIIGSGPLHVPVGGVLRSSTAGAESSVDVVVDLAGRIEPTAGTLNIASLTDPAAGATSGVVSTAGGSLLLDAVSVAAGSTISSESDGVVLRGEVSGAGQFRVSTGDLSVNSAAMSGSGVTTVASGASMTVRNADYYGLVLSGTRSLVNNGTVTLAEEAGTPYQSLLLNEAGTSVTNNGTLDLQAGADIIGSGGLTNTSTGTLTKSTTTTQSDVTTTVENDGVVSSDTGTLSIDGSGTPGESAGSFSASATATTQVGGLLLGDGAQLLGPTPAGSGRVTIAGNAVVVPAGAVVDATGRTGLEGTLSGAGELGVVSGSLAVDSAFMEGSGTTTVASGASMTVRNADYYGLVLSGTRSLVNNGTVTLAEEVGTPYQSLLLNEAGTSVTNNGTLDLQAGADIIGSGPLHVPVGGVLRSSTAGAESSVDVVVDLAGRIEPTAGTLNIASLTDPAAGATSGVVSTAGGSLLLDAVSVAAGSTISSESDGVVLRGEVSGAGQFRVSTGDLSVNSAAMSGSGVTTVASGASMTVRNADYYGLVLSGTRSLVNNGTVTLAEEAGTPYQSLLLNEAGTSVTNNGTLDLQAGADIIGSGGLTNTSTGTLTKSTTTTQSDVSVATDNFGTVRSLNGVLNISGAFPAMAGTTLSRGNYEMVSPGKVRLPADVARNNATILLDGAAAALQDSANATNGLANLNRVGPTGSLTVKNGRVQPVGNLTQEGTVVVGPGAGSALTAPSYTQIGGLTTIDSGDSRLQTTGVVSVTGGVLRGTGTVVAGGTGLSVTLAGTLQPGLSGPGVLSVTGNLTVSGTGTLAVDVNGTSAAAHDTVAVTGAAVTSGKIDLTTGFAPVIGDTATVLTTGGTRSGSFSAASGGNLPGDISWAADYAPTSFSVRAARPTLAAADASVTEGDSGTRQLTFTLTQSENLLAATSVAAATIEGSATVAGPTFGGSDFDATSVTATIPLGSTTTTVDVTVRSDVVYEHNDAFSLALSSPDNLTISDGSATGTILNDEAIPTLTLGNASAIELDTGESPNATGQAVLSGPSAFTTSATWTTTAGTAAASDYTTKSAKVSFAPGVVLRNVPVPVTGDVTTEDDETFGVTLSNGAPSGDVTTGDPATYTIRDDDAAVSIAPATGQEPPTGTTTLTTTVTLSHPNPRPVTLQWATVDGSATAPGDYVAVAPTALTIPTGATARNITLTINSDAVTETVETFTVPLSLIVGGQPGTASATMTILPNRCTVWGTSGSDPNLLGTPGDDVICGLGGNDTIRPGTGHDEIYGGSPSGTGSDGTDTITYDDLTCGVEVDLLNGYAEDALGGGPCIGVQRDEVSGIENITGGAGADTFRGDTAANIIRGNSGNDMLLGDGGNDKLYGGVGVDAASYVRGYSTGVTVDLTTTVEQNTVGAGSDLLSSIEGLFGTPLVDHLFGSIKANTLSGLEGNDEIRGRAGNDTLFGLAGDDSLFGDEGNDKAFGDVGADILFGGDGTDTLHGDDDVDHVDGQGGDNDRVWGDAGIETVLDLLGGAGIGDFCGQGANSASGAVAGAGCEN